MTEERMRALHFSNDMVDDVTKLVYLHLRIHTYALGWTDRAVRRYVRDAGPLLTELNDSNAADCHNPEPPQSCHPRQRMNELVDRIASLREREELRRHPTPARRASGHGRTWASRPDR